MNNQNESVIIPLTTEKENGNMAFDKNKYDNQYKKEHYWRPNVVFPIEMKETVLEVAKKHNLSVAKLSIQAIIREIERLEKESK